MSNSKGHFHTQNILLTHDDILQSPTNIDLHTVKKDNESKYISYLDKFTISRSAQGSNTKFNSIVKNEFKTNDKNEFKTNDKKSVLSQNTKDYNTDLENSMLDTKMYECSLRAKQNLNGIILVKNVLSRVLRRHIIQSNLFNPQNSLRDDKQKKNSNSVTLKNALPRTMYRIIGHKIRVWFECIKFRSNAKIVERLFNGYKLQRMLQLIKLNHSFVKSKTLRLFYKNSILRKADETISTINHQLSHHLSHNNSCIVNNQELFQTTKIKLMIEQLKKIFINRISNQYRIFNDNSLEINPKLDHSFFTCKNENMTNEYNFSAKRSIFDDHSSNKRYLEPYSNQRNLIPNNISQINSTLEQDIKINIKLINNGVQLMNKILIKKIMIYYNELKQRSIKFQFEESKVKQDINIMCNRINKNILINKKISFNRWTNFITTFKQSSKVNEIEDTQFSVYKKNSINNQSLYIIFNIIDCARFRLIFSSFNDIKAKQIDKKTKQKGIQKVVKLFNIVNKLNPIHKINFRYSFMIWGKQARLMNLEDRLNFFKSTNNYQSTEINKSRNRVLHYDEQNENQNVNLNDIQLNDENIHNFVSSPIRTNSVDEMLYSINRSAQNLDLENSIQSPKSKCKICSSGRISGRNKREYFSPSKIQTKHQGCKQDIELNVKDNNIENNPNQIISPKNIKSPKMMSPKNNNKNLGRFNPSGKYVQLKSKEKTASLLSPNNINTEKSISLLSPNLKGDKGNKKLISLISLDNL